jgi:methanogen homoaconitase large subunit
MTLCNMAIEMGGKAGIVPPDARTFEYLNGRAVEGYTPVFATKDAAYCDVLDFNGADLSPQVACPPDVDNVRDVG